MARSLLSNCLRILMLNPYNNDFLDFVLPRNRMVFYHRHVHKDLHISVYLTFNIFINYMISF